MSTDTKDDAPPSTDDATRQDADERQVLWRITPEIVEQWQKNPELFEQFKEAERIHGDQINAYSESILLAAFRYDVDADPPLLPPPPPIHPDVTIDDMSNAINVLFRVISALRDGTRHELDDLRAALDLFAVRRGDVQQGKEEQYVFFMHYVGMDAANYHRLRADGKRWPLRFLHFRTSSYLLQCDPAFAKVDDAYAEKCYEEIVWGGNNREKNTWKRAAAKIAVSVGAFGSLQMGNTNDERVDALLKKRLATAWTELGQKRFQDPEEYLRESEARMKRLARK